MSTLFQVGAGSGGMVVLDLLCREPNVRRIVLVEPDVYKTHNVHRHYFGHDRVGRLKGDLAAEWVKQFRPDLEVTNLAVDLLDPARQAEIEAAVRTCDLGVCAVDNEPAKYHFDALMRKHGKPWTLGEVLSGGIGGWIHLIRPGEACYGCVASHLRRTVKTDASPPPDYANPGGPVPEAAIPASKTAINVIAGLHAGATLGLLARAAPEFTSLLLPLAKVDGVFAEALRPFKFRIPRSPECLICGAQTAPAGRNSMWRWIRHWRDWAMNEIVIPRRLAGQPQALYFRSEKGGLTLDNQPVPWSAEAVVVEALLRLPPAARRRGDFSLRVPGFDPIPAEILKADEAGQRHRLYFRFPVPKATGTAELMWKTHVLGAVVIPVVTPEQFLTELRMDLATAFVSVLGRSVAAQTFVTTQQQGLTASAVVRSPTGLVPLLDLGLSATFRTARGTKTVVTPVPLTASQLAGKEALVTALPPRLPRKAGEWTVTWTCPGRELATTRLKAITPRAFRDSLRVADTRFGIVTPEGDFRVVRQMPADGVVKAGPVFFVASREPGLGGLAEFEIGVQMPGVDRSPSVLEQTVLITDGPTPVAPGMLPMTELKHASAFELRVRGRVLGVLPLSPVPTATFTAEGGYKPPPEFTWSAAAEDELSDRLARLMGAPPPEN